MDNLKSKCAKEYTIYLKTKNDKIYERILWLIKILLKINNFKIWNKKVIKMINKKLNKKLNKNKYN